MHGRCIRFVCACAVNAIGVAVAVAVHPCPGLTTDIWHMATFDQAIYRASSICPLLLALAFASSCPVYLLLPCHSPYRLLTPAVCRLPPAVCLLVTTTSRLLFAARPDFHFATILMNLCNRLFYFFLAVRILFAFSLHVVIVICLLRVTPLARVLVVLMIISLFVNTLRLHSPHTHTQLHKRLQACIGKYVTYVIQTRAANSTSVYDT